MNEKYTIIDDISKFYEISNMNENDFKYYIFEHCNFYDYIFENFYFSNCIFRKCNFIEC